MVGRYGSYPVLPASMAMKAMASITGATAAANQTTQYANLTAQNVKLALEQSHLLFLRV